MVLVFDLMAGSGWMSYFVKAGLVTSGVADSLSKVSHIKKSRHFLQILLAALQILKEEAYRNRNDQNLVSWEEEMKQVSPMFFFGDLIIRLILNMLQLVKSIRTGDWIMYVDSVRRIAPWFFVFDHFRYARWLPVQSRDIESLQTTNPELLSQFKNGKFVAKKSQRSISAIALDQAHEQMNAKVKGDGGAIGILGARDGTALNRWVTSGPEVCDVITEFKQSS